VEEVERLDGAEVAPRRERSVSCTPGADGAEVSGVKCVAWAAGGTKRRD
jgi:hypothetical protein